MGQLILDLGSRRAVRESLSGGKGAGLARLRRAGFRVPPGFVITTAVFHGALTAAVRRIAFENGPPDLENLEAVRDSFLSWDIIPAHRNAILRAYRRLGGPVAVRSSLVGEDSKKASFAGQLDTFLNVSGEEEVLAAVRKCLASAFGSRLWAYVYQKDGTSADGMSMAVIVQSMIKAVVSGVAFSADPVGCESGVIIESVPGLGNALVQGQAIPDRHRVDAGGELAAAISSGPALLGTDKMRELAITVQSIADRFGTPQDVEWAFDGREFFILQARPITSLASRRVYSKRIVSDLAPGLVKPLLWSMEYQPIAGNVLAPVFEEILGRSGADYSRFIARFHSRVYADVTMFDELAARAGLPFSFSEATGRDEQASSRKLRFRPRSVPLLYRVTRSGLKQLRVERQVGRFMEAQRRVLAPFRAIDWPAVEPQGLLEHLDRLIDLHGNSRRHLVRMTLNARILNRFLERLLRKWAPKTDPAAVLRGCGRRGTLQLYEGLARLAEDARDLDPRLLGRIGGEEKLDVRAELFATAEGRQLIGHFDIFMNRYGFLSANGSDFSEVPWAESPRLVWKSVARIALAHPSTLWDTAEARRREALGRVRAGFGPQRRLIFGRIHDAAVRLMDRREKLSLVTAEEFYHVRRCVLALGSQLVSRSVIGDAADVFYLYEDEFRRILADPREAARAWGLVNARKAELTADAAMDPPETICSGEAPAPPRPAEAEQARLEGTGASTGIATGRARIVRDPFLAPDRPGESDVVVVPFTDAGWMPFLCGAGGIVAETGGELSHTSIIAREFGIPAVVGVPKAASLIQAGRLITVDGTAGRVYLHPEEEPQGSRQDK